MDRRERSEFACVCEREKDIEILREREREIARESQREREKKQSHFN